MVVPPVGYHGADGVNQPIAMAPAEAVAYRKKAREIRLSESIKAVGVRKIDLPQVWAKLLCVLTPEGIDQIKNLPEWAAIEESGSPI